MNFTTGLAFISLCRALVLSCVANCDGEQQQQQVGRVPGGRLLGPVRRPGPVLRRRRGQELPQALPRVASRLSLEEAEEVNTEVV